MTAMDCNIACVTVSTAAGDVTLPRLAVMLLVPALTPGARPLAAIVATEGVAPSGRFDVNGNFQLAML